MGYALNETVIKPFLSRLLDSQPPQADNAEPQLTPLPLTIMVNNGGGGVQMPCVGDFRYGKWQAAVEELLPPG